MASWRPTTARSFCSGTQSKDLDACDEGASRGKISLECGNAQPEMDDIVKYLNNVFLTPNEAYEAENARTNASLAEQKKQPQESRSGREPDGLPRTLPVWWRSLCSSCITPTGSNYNEIARNAGYQATTVFRLIVDADGLPKNINVTCNDPVGVGLDDEAVQAVESWTVGGSGNQLSRVKNLQCECPRSSERQRA